MDRVERERALVEGGNSARRMSQFMATLLVLLALAVVVLDISGDRVDAITFLVVFVTIWVVIVEIRAIRRSKSSMRARA